MDTGISGIIKGKNVMMEEGEPIMKERRVRKSIARWKEEKKTMKIKENVG